ncbi:multidrug effflux MFS transporter [Myxococcaceae bacterium GXIMD 01537]
MSSPSTPERTAPLMLVLGSLTAFAPLSIDMYLPALPTLQGELATSASAVQLTLAAFMAGLGVGQLAYGPLSDRFGRKAPLAAGIVLYILASAACALAPSIQWLIALRFLQAVGGAAGPVIARAVVRDLYGGREAARVLSLLMLTMGAAPIFAPTLGGWVLGFAGWRAIFWVLAALGVACLLFAVALLPAKKPSAGGPPVPGALGRNVRALLADRRFIAATLAGGFAQAGMFAYISGSPFVMMELHRVPPETFARLFGFNAAGLIAASQVNRWLLTHQPPSRIVSAAALGTFTVGGVLVGLAVSGVGGVWAIASALFLFLSCTGFITPNAAALALESHGSRAGVASSVLGSAQYAVAAGAASLVGLFNDGSMRPMAVVMALCAGSAWVAGLVAAGLEPARQPLPASR